MHHNQKMLFGIILSIIVLFSGFPYQFVAVHPSINIKTSIETNTIINIEPGAQRLNLQLDDSDNRHMIYLTGGRPLIEPNGEESFSEAYVASHGMRSAFFDRFELQITNVTDELVFPYHYDLRVDSLGQIHTTFVTGNYTLYYALRDITGQWQYTNLTQPDEMFAMMPAITLGNNEQPRIVYTVMYKENGNNHFSQTGGESIDGMFSVHYTVLNGSEWLFYDVGDNHSDNPFNFEERIDFTRQFTFNPGIKIEDGFAYIVFTNKVKTAADTRMNYLKISEIPSADTDFKILTHHRAIVAVSPATTYRRPDIHLLGDGIVLAFGAWQFGGVSVAYLTNSSVLEDPNIILAREQWTTEYLMDPTKLNKQVESVSSIEQDGTITVTWSFYDLSNDEYGLFSQDVFIASFTPSGGEIGEIDLARSTLTNQIYHYSPNIAATGDDELIILYIVEDEDGVETNLVEIDAADIVTVTETDSDDPYTTTIVCTITCPVGYIADNCECVRSSSTPDSDVSDTTTTARLIDRSMILTIFVLVSIVLIDRFRRLKFRKKLV